MAFDETRFYEKGLTRSKRQDLVEEYKEEEQRKSLKINPGKRVNLSTGDPLNMPRHKVHGVCSAFQECPICYKCRSYDSSHMACRSCVLTQEGSLCKRELHTEQALNMMIRRERIDLDAGRFEVHYKHVEENKGFIEKIKLPDGTMIRYDEAADKIDFEPMRPFIGNQFDYFIDGVGQGKRKLTDIKPTKSGVNAIWMDGPEEPM
ncbi:hypothetical protein GZH47_33720 (plasmid) [Paenibacillus rhizovicinus]|uniref:Uncharacterized protein n=1 Tax=Paenibacillus rhizovicinus TaxID=2704463 RepID=A0A6C0PCZ8_9BACL|nr:hypothetical protein [Paenibacillus rhizovicinus]QHW35852.1 hypothetical protein GZH47_33720 [Paenibacillus rhizovicinus]